MKKQAVHPSRDFFAIFSDGCRGAHICISANFYRHSQSIQAANDPNSALSKLPIAEKLKAHDAADIQRVYLFLGASVI